MKHGLLACAMVIALSSGCSLRRVQLTGTGHVSGWADQVRAVAVIAYPYAQMSANAYGEHGPYDLGPDVKRIEYADNDERGFAYAVYERRGSEGLETVIAFRGTEFTKMSDWFYGNVLSKQNKSGVAVFDRVRSQTGLSRPIIVTGHSLGGAIATQVSLLRPGATAFIFNSSPRFRRGRDIVENRRVSVVEYGEVLKAVRIFGREATQDYYSIGCTGGLNPIRQHGMRLLADCLTRIAAYEDRAGRESLVRNRIAPPPLLPSS